MKEIVLRSGKPKNFDTRGDRENAECLQEEPPEANKELEPKEVIELAVKSKNESTKEPAITEVPFPSRLGKKQRWDEDEFVSFLNLFKTLNINFPLIELIEKVPKYTQFLKEIMSSCRKIKIGEQANISASCSSILSR
ncbi:reverse transcriptase [Gossypium australe]|uniref:Reverse transcriptase n=1 Tax=Gossypium australe TaxID=47621 RepID=A0A5B6WMD6_9ROSI|nr:reverse transcriptase [Gossypium australe]